VEGLLAAHAGNVTAAARAADVERMYFHRLLQRYGLR
jgi:transcriptional regulator of acetoin/glycerol metabolism